MEFPLALRAAIEARTASIPQARLLRDAQALSERYRGESGAGNRLLTTEEEAAAYSVVRMPATFGAVAAALSQALAHLEARPASLLDVGAGTGAAAWAADALLELREIACLEREDAMRRLGETYMRSGPAALQRARWICGDLNEGVLPVCADLVIASYVLNEMRRPNRLRAAERLWDAADQLLLLVEPGTPAGYAQLREVRDLLLQRGAHIAAPCPHEGPCPMADDDWCHFTCRVQRSRLHKQLKGGEAPYEDEKFAYLALTREPCSHAAARVLRHPFIESGRVTLQLCGEEGLRTAVVRKRDGADFKRARKTDCGDEF